MRRIRGSVPSPERDRARTQEAVDRVAGGGESVLRVWRPPAQVAFGRRDSNRPGYDRARELATERGFPAVERAVGGHAVCFTGNTVSFVRATPVDDPRSGITDRYERTTREVRGALSRLGVVARKGEPEGAFCPGSHSLSDGGKIVGLAQRVRRDVAVVAGIVVVSDHEAIAGVLAPVYDALDAPFERDAVGSLARAGGETDPDAVVRTLEDALARGEGTVEQVRET